MLYPSYTLVTLHKDNKLNSHTVSSTIQNDANIKAVEKAYNHFREINPELTAEEIFDSLLESAPKAGDINNCLEWLPLNVRTPETCALLIENKEYLEDLLAVCKEEIKSLTVLTNTGKKWTEEFVFNPNLKMRKEYLHQLNCIYQALKAKNINTGMMISSLADYSILVPLFYYRLDEIKEYQDILNVFDHCKTEEEARRLNKLEVILPIAELKRKFDFDRNRGMPPQRKLFYNMSIDYIGLVNAYSLLHLNKLLDWWHVAEHYSEYAVELASALIQLNQNSILEKPNVELMEKRREYALSIAELLCWLKAQGILDDAHRSKLEKQLYRAPELARKCRTLDKNKMHQLLGLPGEASAPIVLYGNPSAFHHHSNPLTQPESAATLNLTSKLNP